jgi:hypothetical protein
MPPSALNPPRPPGPQGKDPVGLLLEARERRARSEMASAQDHQARAMARLRERYCAVVGAESAKVRVSGDRGDATQARQSVWLPLSVRCLLQGHDPTMPLKVEHKDVCLLCLPPLAVATPLLPLYPSECSIVNPTPQTQP